MLGVTTSDKSPLTQVSQEIGTLESVVVSVLDGTNVLRNCMGDVHRLTGDRYTPCAHTGDGVHHESRSEGSRRGKIVPYVEKRSAEETADECPQEAYGHRLPQPHGEYRIESDDVREPQLRPGNGDGRQRDEGFDSVKNAGQSHKYRGLCECSHLAHVGIIARYRRKAEKGRNRPERRLSP